MGRYGTEKKLKNSDCSFQYDKLSVVAQVQPGQEGEDFFDEMTLEGARNSSTQEMSQVGHHTSAFAHAIEQI